MMRWCAIVVSASAMACGSVSRQAAGPEGVRPLGASVPCVDEAMSDGDRDGLDDACELALAQTFAPMLRLDSADCAWSPMPATRLQAGTLFVAQPVGDTVRLAYVPAYARDCGWRGVVCWGRGRACSAHAGDSELIVVDVQLRAGRWITVGVFLSAHCGGGRAGRCRWYRDGALAAFDWANVPYGAPVVWVSHGKHANYPTARSCDRGHWFQDSCDRNEIAVRFPIVTQMQNLGSRQAPAPTPGGCVTAEHVAGAPAGIMPGTVECFWDERRAFTGWQRVATVPAPTAYGHLLAQVAGF